VPRAFGRVRPVAAGQVDATNNGGNVADCGHSDWPAGCRAPANSGRSRLPQKFPLSGRSRQHAKVVVEARRRGPFATRGRDPVLFSRSTPDAEAQNLHGDGSGVSSREGPRL
jgi:hypothetical protein